MVCKHGGSLTGRVGKVVFIGPNLKAGGAERQWALLAPSLAERGFEVSVMTLDGRGVYTWRLDRVLLGGLTALDATLHLEEGIFWLVRARKKRDPRELEVPS